MRSAKSLAAVLAAASLTLAACGGSDDTSSTDGGSSAESTASVVLTGNEQLKYDPTTATAAAGDVTIQLTSLGVVHNVVIEGVNGDAVVVEAQVGETNTGTVTLAAGEYVFFCNVAGHRDAGMEGVLTVS